VIETKSTFKNETGKVKKAVNNATYVSINQCAASIRLIARRSIKPKKGKSAAGTPPHTHRKRLPNSIIYYADKQLMYAIVGPSYDIAGTSGKAHEFGGKYKKQNYDKRPFMLPAAEKAAPRMPENWASNYK
jgi:hypothetical protein